MAWLGWSNWGYGGEKNIQKEKKSINANSACTRIWVQGFKLNVKQRAQFVRSGLTGGLVGLV